MSPTEKELFDQFQKALTMLLGFKTIGVKWIENPVGDLTLYIEGRYTISKISILHAVRSPENIPEIVMKAVSPLIADIENCNITQEKLEEFKRRADELSEETLKQKAIIAKLEKYEAYYKMTMAMRHGFDRKSVT